MSKLNDKKVILSWYVLQRIRGTMNKLPARIYEALNEKILQICGKIFVLSEVKLMMLSARWS